MSSNVLSDLAKVTWPVVESGQELGSPDFPVSCSLQLQEPGNKKKPYCSSVVSAVALFLSICLLKDTIPLCSAQQPMGKQSTFELNHCSMVILTSMMQY